MKSSSARNINERRGDSKEHSDRGKNIWVVEEVILLNLALAWIDRNLIGQSPEEGRY